MKLFEVILKRKDLIEKSKVQCADPFLHMKQIVGLAMNLTQTEVYLNWDKEIVEKELKEIDDILSRRISGEPFQYIAGYEWFWDSRFFVGPGVFIPRPETEILVEILLNHCGDTQMRIAELGSGCGNIGISVLLSKRNIEWHGYEINQFSIPYLEKNIKNLLYENQSFSIHSGDFFVESLNHGLFDIIVSNPPYVAKEDYDVLPTEIYHEPFIALYGGNEGLDVIEKLILVSRNLLKKSGALIFEISPEQMEKVKKILVKNGFNLVDFFKDYCGNYRAVKAIRS